MNEFYEGYHGELYDIFYANKPYAEEAQFISQCLQQHGLANSHSILELACGTGSHALELTKLGYEVVGTDVNQSMLDRAVQKSAEHNLSVKFLRQDMRDLNLTDGPFDATLCLFDSIGYVQTNQNLQRVFARIHSLLKPDGLFIFDFWHAAAMLCSYEPTRSKSWALQNRELVRVSKTTLNVADQLAEVAYTIYDLNDNGTFSVLRELHVNRYFLRLEMDQWLRSSGFTPVKWLAGFEANETIDQNTWHILTVAKRNS